MVVAHSEDYIHRFSWFHITGFGSMPMFFALSGFLVAAIVLRNKERTGTVDFKSFMWRRLTRLGAPLVLFSVVYFIVNWAEGYSLRTEPGSKVFGIAPTVATIVTYTNNLVPSFGYLQHFDSVHMWSLGVDMQMYFLIPLFLAILLYFTKNVFAMSSVVVLIIILVQFTRYWEYQYYYVDRADPHTITGAIQIGAVYQRPENSLDAFMVGVLVCVLWKRRVLPETLCKKVWIPVFAVFMYFIIFVGIESKEAYAGGYAVIMVCSFVLVIETIRSGSPLNRLFGSYPLRLMGRFSYTIYIWHLLIFVSIDRWFRSKLPGGLLVLIAWVLLAAVSVVAWWIAERPLLRLPPVRNPRPVET